MGLSRLAQEFAAEIKQHDWSDAPYRPDRAGHNRERDYEKSSKTPVLNSDETEVLRLNVMWVTAQVLAHAERTNFDVVEFAQACGVNTEKWAGGIQRGLRIRNGRCVKPGTWDELSDD
ncbi:hypothetical protein AB0J81_07965 [Streptomyces bobili]|uniref:hypothetical protein n=1 Tax=Streptomyces bobili TaxID=67280 RepID=UPI00341ADD88